MTQRKNNLGQPIGDPVSDWKPVALPPRTSITGRYCRIEPLDVERHLHDLYDAFSEDAEGSLWTYMAVGPFASIDDFQAWMKPASKTNDPLFHALIDLSTGKAVGMAAYMRIKQDVAVIEVGNISYSPRLQRTPTATEAMFLMMKRVFHELGYRRYEWKCDSLNEASRRAAERLGFNFDGLFKQAVIYKGRNRDTAWYSILDSDWPRLENAYRKWLSVDNFDKKGHQKQRLQEFTANGVGAASAAKMS
jgi:RimJ/RimL family protein N-acetyltransferase